MSNDPYDSIIWSADVGNMTALLQHLDAMPKLKYVKIDRAFVDEYGWKVFDVLADRGLRVFDDAKISEVPSKLVEVAAVHVRKAHPWMLGCMAGSLSNGSFDATSKHRDGLLRFVEMCWQSGVQACGVTILSSKTPEAVANEFNGRNATDQVLYYAEQLQAAGFTNIVCSPHEAKVIRKDSHFDCMDIHTPGIRPSGSLANDQARVMTPTEAIRSGADKLIIGRPITEGPGTPAENLAAIAAELAAEASYETV